VLFIYSIILGCLCLLGCSESLDEPDDDMGIVDPRLISANTDFGFRLFVELSRQHDGENIFISPLSVSIALAMTYNGAEGETQQAMAETLEGRIR
jgi:serine protease inhibitor